jgi:tetratricopeptide (TPR) repeat protein
MSERRAAIERQGSAVERPAVPERPAATVREAQPSIQQQDTADRTMSPRGGLVGRLSESRQRALGEQDGQTPVVGVRPQSPTASAERTRAPGATDSIRGRAGLREQLTDRRTAVVDRPTVSTSPTAAVQQQVAETTVRHRGLGSRLSEYYQERGITPTDPSTPISRTGTIRTDSVYRRPTYLHTRYYDRPDLVRHDYRYTHTYYDRYHRIHHRVIWPRYSFAVYYDFGPRVVVRHVYPYYHRKYVFVSLGGFWPVHYTYTRYYWYGHHPYVWHGYYPIAREVSTTTHNYYTYNYYYNGDGTQTSYSTDARQPVDQSTWADVRQKLDGQQAGPAPQTLADTRFEEGVKNFEAGDYGIAARRFEEAMRHAPHDMILPFAYAQALFANGQYTESAEVLRQALSNTTPEQEGVFYPRGLYANDDVLFAQIEKLVDRLDSFGYDADMQLLLGYHLLGVGETGYAREPLERAAQDTRNAESAQVLLRLVEKIEREAAAALRTSEAGAEPSNATVQTDGQAGTAATAMPETGTTPGVPVQVRPEAQPQQAPDADEAGPLTETNTGGVTPILLQSDAGPSGRGPTSPGGTDTALAPRPAMAIADVSRYLRADFAVFAGIVLLGWTGIYVQWKLLDRRRI